ncbi:hypothetical protein MATR_30140 [Marivirga tractuosa]|uniref:KWG Leptospira repeat protein n=1 Tax=Marivirga tractuosa (strain ATCC 23168 / DSM 4126 / NBRC 15989 / NCIMB 1408 / VKM B-1430 / H-43) TaxID=643867 RepID=E4TV72_MARTH|nr:WG repeat-containing protein [Marivirga tractuosa]ADR23137.1 hypothetical protein Ftrac_3162 [Marivirga tractuosa DSM 4126]BDD16189.1 hypothetical protein MATR_30140 [Marivirga tractuosa]
MTKYFLFSIVSFSLLYTSCTENSNQSEEESISETSLSYVEKDTSFVLKQFDPNQIWPFKSNDKWGYKNNEDEFVIRPIFDGCGFFSKGFAWVKENETYKIINNKGDYIDKSASFDAVGKTKAGIIPTKKGKLWGAVDTTANQIIEYNYEEIKILDSNLVLIKKNRSWGLINRVGEEVCLPVYDREIVFEDGLAIVTRNYRDVGIINKSGKEIVKCQYEDVAIINDSTFRIAVKSNRSQNSYGLIVNEKIKYPAEYKRIASFQDSLLVLTKDSISGILNMKGDTIMNFKYSDLKPGNTNILAAEANKKWGYINIDSDTIIDFKFDEADPFRGDLAIVYNGPTDRYTSKPTNSALINFKGDIILPFETRKLKFLSANLLMRYKYNYNINLYKKDGAPIDSIYYDSQQFNSPEDPITGYLEDEIEFYKFTNGFAIIGHKGRMGMVNEKGDIVIPLKYHHLEPMNEYGYTKAQYLDKYGIVDSEGNEIVPIGYEHIGYDDENDLFFLQKEDDSRDYGDRLVNEGYWNYEGELLSNSPLKSPKVYDLKEQIGKIRQAYNNIESEAKQSNFSTFKLEKGNIEMKKSYNKIIVNDSAKGIQYENFYNSSLNKYGPFFIFKVEGEKENRYYYQHGRIIRWLDKDKKDRLISDAIYSPEHDEHVRARRFKSKGENKELTEKYGLDTVRNKIDSLCTFINENIAKGIYKKGDTKSRSMGEYQRLEEVYIDSLQNVMYKLDAGSDEGGSAKEEEFYFNGELIRKYSDKNYFDNSDNVPDAQWVSGQYAVTKYYNNGNLIFTEKTENGVMTIKKN